MLIFDAGNTPYAHFAQSVPISWLFNALPGTAYDVSHILSYDANDYCTYSAEIQKEIISKLISRDPTIFCITEQFITVNQLMAELQFVYNSMAGYL